MVAVKRVVVTGASRGIGHECAIRLRDNGFRVFAGVRTSDDADAARENALIPLQLDVTDDEAIGAAAKRVADEAGAEGLYGLVNNGGVCVPGPLEYLPLDELRRQLEVNLVGQLAVTQRFLPALRLARGRIVNVSSVNGRLALPVMGAYSVAKHGIEALSDVLRLELRPAGVHVSVVQPGAIATEMASQLRRDIDAVYAELPAVAHQHYGTTFRQHGRTMADNNEFKGSPPSVVAGAVLAALTDRRPRPRYAIGSGARQFTILGRMLPDRIIDWMILRSLERRR
jgi:NAD(P)-dependent dehydrogenase (short-subunit alcohol dehydrogenase family)